MFNLSDVQQIVSPENNLILFTKNKKLPSKFSENQSSSLQLCIEVLLPYSPLLHPLSSYSKVQQGM